MVLRGSWVRSPSPESVGNQAAVTNGNAAAACSEAGSRFTVEARYQVRDRVLHLATADPRVVAGAIVGSCAQDAGDRWSDLDLTFAVADAVPLRAVLGDWTRAIVDAFDATHLLDLPSGATSYRARRSRDIGLFAEFPDRYVVSPTI